MSEQEKQLEQLRLQLQEEHIKHEHELQRALTTQSQSSRRMEQELHRVKQENMDLQALVNDSKEQREFYEKALEERFEQMEQFEQECEQLREQMAKMGGKQEDIQRAVALAVQKEKEEAKKRQELMMNQHNAEKENMLTQIAQLNQQYQDLTIISEKRAEENFTLKQRLDQQRQELEKLRRREEVLEDQVRAKEAEVKLMKEDLEKRDKREKQLRIMQ